ncbi:MAG: hypothetical protein IPM39_02535 [Chloroflexi bacterium]|nr:hypothetical protein [Chloroflexota bacterium]
MSFSFLWKQRAARLMAWPALQWLMRRGMAIVGHFVAHKRPVGVGMVALDEDGRILLLHPVVHPCFPWGLPGGWLNRRESPQANTPL